MTERGNKEEKDSEEEERRRDGVTERGSEEGQTSLHFVKIKKTDAPIYTPH